MQLSIIIVNYNVKYYLYQCLESLRRACQGLEWEVLVIDNQSSDGSFDYLRKNYPDGTFKQLRLIQNKENVGFGRANNIAYAQSRGKYILFINPDTFVGEETIKDCLTFMLKTPECGCLGVRMLNADGSFAPESRRGTPTPWVSFCKITRLSVLFPKNKHFGRYYMQHLPIDKTSQIEIVSGAYMMISREVIEKIGLFDEDYFMYCEDTDLSYRMLLAGFHNYYLPSPILHYKGESTRKYSYSFFNTFYKAILLFFRKHYNGHISILRIIINVAICILGIGSFIRGKFRKTIYVIKKQFVSRPLRLLCLSGEANRCVLQEYGKKFDLQIIHFDYPHNSTGLAEAIEKHKPDYIVFDTSTTDYREILQTTYNLPRHLKRQIATFYPERNVIITSLHIFAL